MPSPPNPASNPHRRPGRQSSSTRPSPTGSAGTSGNRPTPPGNRQRLDRGPGTHLWSQALTPPPRPADSPDAPTTRAYRPGPDEDRAPGHRTPRRHHETHARPGRRRPPRQPFVTDQTARQGGQLVRKGLLDELNLLVHPIVVGDGLARLFPPTSRAPLFSYGTRRPSKPAC